MNKNDEAPVFTVNEYYGSVTEELDGSPVFVLQVKTIVLYQNVVSDNDVDVTACINNTQGAPNPMSIQYLVAVAGKMLALQGGGAT